MLKMNSLSAIYGQLGIFFIGRLFSMLAAQMILFALPLLVFQATKQVHYSGFAFMIEWLPAILCLPILGVLVDHFSERRLYYYSDLMRGSIALLTAFLLFYTKDFSYIVLLFTAASLGVLDALNFVALESTVGRHISQNNIPRVQSIIQAIEHGAEILGPALCGLLLFYFIKQQLFYLAGFLFFLSILGNIQLRKLTSNKLEKKQPTKKIEWKNAIKKSFHLLFENNIVLCLVFLTMLVNFLFGILFSTLPVLLIGILGVSDHSVALLITCGGITGFVCLSLMSIFIEHIGTTRLGLISLVLLTLGGSVISSSHSFYVVAFGYSVFIASVGFFNVFLRSERIKHLDLEHIGKAMSAIVICNRLGLPLAGLLVGLLATNENVQSLIGIFTMGVFILSVPFYIYILTRQPSAIAEESI